MSLRHLSVDDLVALDGLAVRALLKRRFSSGFKLREREYKAALLSARLNPSSDHRPSVESAMHMATRPIFTVHLHTSLVNALTCSVHGRAITKRLFGERVCYLDYIFPGIRLAKAVAAHQHHRFSATGQVYFLENHGAIYTADSAAEIFAQIREITRTIANYLAALRPERKPADRSPQRKVVRKFVTQLKRAYRSLATKQSIAVAHLADEVVLSALCRRNARTIALAGPLTPDQVVYCGPEILWLDRAQSERSIAAALARHQREHGELPKVILHRQLGLMTLGATPKSARIAQRVYRDALVITEGALLLGGVNALTHQEAQAIHTWEVEAFRRTVSSS